MFSLPKLAQIASRTCYCPCRPVYIHHLFNSLGSIHPHTCFKAPWVMQIQLPSLSIARYSGPSFSGHSQQGPPSLLWPHIFGLTTMNMMNTVIYLSLSSNMSKGTSLMWPQFLGKEGGLIRGGLNCTHLQLSELRHHCHHPYPMRGSLWLANWLLQDSNPWSCGWQADALTIGPSHYRSLYIVSCKEVN